MRVAIVNTIPIHRSTGGVAQYSTDLATNLVKRGVKVMLFSLSPEENTFTSNGYIEKEIVQPGYSSSGSSMGRMVDYFSIGVLGSRPSVSAMNKNTALINGLAKFNPDAIISPGYQLTDILIKYVSSQNRKKVALVADLDSYKSIIYDYELGINRMRESYPGLVVDAFESFIKENYLRYGLEMYGRMIKAADAVVFPSKAPEIETVKKYGKHGIYVEIPRAFISPLKNRPKPSKKVRKIAFIGSYLYGPNTDAVNFIEKKIAPMLPDKKFIIAGKDCPKKTVGNINYLGEVKDIEEVIAKSDVCLAPIVTNSGMKMKLAYYFKYSKAVIGTKIALRGYNIKDGYNVIVEDKIEDYCLRIRELENDTRLFQTIQKNAATVAKPLYTETVANLWVSLLKRVVK